MPADFYESRNIGVALYHYTIDGTDYIDDFGKTVSYEEFYGKIAAGSETKTAQVNIAEFQDFFRPYLEKGLDVVHLCFSSGLSGSYNSARNAAAMLIDEFPDNRVYVVDSLAASGGFGLLVDAAADKRDEGLSAIELAEWVNENKLRVHHWFFSTDLSTYVRGGRISKAAAIFGGALEICPLLNMNNLGQLIPREKIRTKKRVIKAIVQKMEENADDGLAYSGKCIITHSNCYDDAKTVADMVEEKFPKLNGKVRINWIGTTIGAHTGPSTVALFFFGKKRED